jgi:hypothetical protein
MEEFKLIALFLCLVLLAFLIFKEVKRSNKNLLVLRLIASIIAVSALFFLNYPLKYKVSQSVKKEEFTLLTKGVNLDSIPKNSLPFFTTDSGIYNKLSKNKVKFLPDLSYYLSANPEIKIINLYGDGLAQNELDRLKNYQINYHPSKNLNGITICNWSATIINTDDLVIQGTYNNPSNKPIKLMLSGLGNQLDSVNLKSNGAFNFSLKTTTNQIGYFTYQLSVTQNKDTLESQTIPFEVIEKQPTKILILAAAPDFEYKFLRDWLYQNNFALALRTRISKDKFSTDFFNREKGNLGNVNQNLLQQFDLLIADDAVLANLNSQERNAINTKIENGLGLLIRIGDEKPTSYWAKEFSFSSLADKQDKGFSFKIFNEENKTTPLTVENPFYVNAQSGHQPLVFDERGKIWVDSKISNQGKLAITTLPSSYKWFMKGQKKDYKKYWSALIGNIIKKKEVIEQLSLKNQFPKTNEETMLVYQNNSENIAPKINIENSAIAPIQNQNFPNEWAATFWPKKAGWNKVEVNGLEKQVYIFGQEDWQTANRFQKISNNLKMISISGKNSVEAEEISEILYREVSKWIFFFLFLMSCGFLWYEAKLSTK